MLTYFRCDVFGVTSNWFGKPISPVNNSFSRKFIISINKLWGVTTSFVFCTVFNSNTIFFQCIKKKIQQKSGVSLSPPLHLPTYKPSRFLQTWGWDVQTPGFCWILFFLCIEKNSVKVKNSTKYKIRCNSLKLIDTYNIILRSTLEMVYPELPEIFSFLIVHSR